MHQKRQLYKVKRILKMSLPQRMAINVSMGNKRHRVLINCAFMNNINFFSILKQNLSFNPYLKIASVQF